MDLTFFILVIQAERRHTHFRSSRDIPSRVSSRRCFTACSASVPCAGDGSAETGIESRPQARLSIVVEHLALRASRGAELRGSVSSLSPRRMTAFRGSPARESRPTRQRRVRAASHEEGHRQNTFFRSFARGARPVMAAGQPCQAVVTDSFSWCTGWRQRPACVLRHARKTALPGIPDSSVRGGKPRAWERRKTRLRWCSYRYRLAAFTNLFVSPITSPERRLLERRTHLGRSKGDSPRPTAVVRRVYEMREGRRLCFTIRACLFTKHERREALAHTVSTCKRSQRLRGGVSNLRRQKLSWWLSSRNSTCSRRIPAKVEPPLKPKRASAP